MKLRKFFTLALALCLLLTLLPLQALAAEDNQPPKSNQFYGRRADSPFYPTIRVEEVTASPKENTEDSDVLWESTKTYAPTYLSVEDAAVKLREYMKKRQTSFDLFVLYDDDKADPLLDELLALATAHTGKPTEGDYLMWHLNQWGGTVEKNWDGHTGKYQFRFAVEMSYYTTATQEKELTTAVNSLLKNLNLSGKSDYEKVKAVYDYICNNVTYDYDHLEDSEYLLMYTAYAALVNKTAVCQGYATLLYRLLLELDVDCRVITGLAYTGGAHAWNIVKLGPVYYNLDATWDAEIEPDMFFLLNSDMNLTHYRYLDYRSTQFHTDYPMSETNYVDGVDGEPEYFFEGGLCGDEAYWAIDRDGYLSIGGNGATYNYQNINGHGLDEAAPWFYWLDGFDKVYVDEGITVLGDYLFCTDIAPQNLTEIVLPESLTEIGQYTFRNCDNLEEIRIPDGVTKIGSSAFAGCDNLKTVDLSTTLKTIGTSAFENCPKLTAITLPGTLTGLGDNAFGRCYALKTITIPAGVTYVRGFENCSSLETAYIYGQRVDTRAFSWCSNLKTVVLSDSVTRISSSAFEYCRALETITIPASVTDIGIYAFRECTGLKEIYFEGDAPKLDSRAFNKVTATVYYPAGNETWTEKMFQDYEGTLTWVPYVTHQWSEGPCGQPRTCATCGEIVDDGHVYEGGICRFCGVKEVQKFQIATMRMQLKNELQADFAFVASNLPDRTGCYAIVTQQLENGTRTTTIPSSQWYTEGAYVAIPYTNMAAKEMTDALTIVLYNADGQAVSDSYTSRLAEYAVRAFDLAANKGDTEAMDMYVSMLYYGAAAQEAFGYKKSNKATDYLSDAMIRFVNTTGRTIVDLSETDTNVEGSVGAEYGMGSRAVLESNIQLQLAFQPEFYNAGYTATYSYVNHLGETVKGDLPIKAITDNEGNVTRTIVTVEDLVIADCGALVTIRFYNKSGARVLKVFDSVEHFAVRMNESTTAKEAQKVLAQEIMNFSTSAYNYFH